MLDTLDSTAGWFAANGQTTINPADPTVRAQGKAAMNLTCSVAFTDGAAARRYLVPQDLLAVKACLGAGLDVSYFHLMPGPAAVTGVRVRFIYELDLTPVLPLATKYEDYEVPAVNAGTAVGPMFLNVFDYDAPTLRIGITGDDDPARRKLIAIELQADTLNISPDLRFDAVRITPRAQPGGNFNPCGVAAVAFGIDRLLLPFWKRWLRNPNRATTVQSAPMGHKVVQRAVWEQLDAFQENIRSDTLRESLRRFSAYVQGRNNWEAMRAADELVDTLTSSAAGVGGAPGDPRKVDLVDTVEVERLFQLASPLRPVKLRIGPNARREVEVGEVQAVTPGVGVHLREPLTYAHEAGVYVRSEEYYPRNALRRSGDPIRMTGDAFSLNLLAREVV